MGKTCSCEVTYCYSKDDPDEFNLDNQQDLLRSASAEYFNNDLNADKDKQEMLSAYTSAGTQKNGMNFKALDAPYGSLFQEYNGRDKDARDRWIWNCPGQDPDDIIDDLARLANPFEVSKRTRFSCNGMIDYFETLLREESAENPNDAIASLWVEKQNSNNFKYWQKKEKSNLITMRMEIKQVKKFQIDKISEFMFEPKHKMQWDKNIDEMLYEQTNPKCVNYGRLYYKNKKQIGLDARDYDEKVFTIWYGNKLYRFSSSCFERMNSPNSGGYDLTKNLKISQDYW